MKYFKNISWLFTEKFFNVSIGFAVGVWVARYLAPERFGLLNYAQSFVALFSVLSTLGLNSILTRELVKNEADRDILMGTAFYLRLLGSFIVFCVLAITVNFTSNDRYTNILIFIIASAMFFQGFNIIDYYFQSKVLSKYVVITNIAGLIMSSVIKIVLILIVLL